MAGNMLVSGGCGGVGAQAMDKPDMQGMVAIARGQ